ncbi:MAG: hypothetical protein H6720_06215 [Sandaracinus sp.]|nr:hypothetical protein [Sandaracinus sp.]
MPPLKPKHASEYSNEQLDLVRATCLTIATKVGDLMDELVIVGGLVPSLLIPPPEEGDPHVGTLDLDVGLSLALFDEEQYRTLSERLRGAGFAMDQTEDGKPTRQRWIGEGGVTVDFLIPPSRGSTGGKLQNLERDFAAFVIPGLQCAFQDREKIRIEGRTLAGADAAREVWVCGAGAYMVLKALAFHRRTENKDAYDLFYVLKNYGRGVVDVVARFRPLMDEADATEALQHLRSNFNQPNALGPRAAAEFIHGEPDDATQADVVGFVEQFIRGIEQA